MNQDDIIRMAGKAFETPGTELAYRNGFYTVTPDEVKRFAKLVAAAEREACAKVCDGWLHADGDVCAAAIRAGGEQK